MPSEPSDGAFKGTVLPSDGADVVCIEVGWHDGWLPPEGAVVFVTWKVPSERAGESDAE